MENQFEMNDIRGMATPFFQPVLQMLNCPIVSVMCM